MAGLSVSGKRVELKIHPGFFSDGGGSLGRDFRKLVITHCRFMTR